MGVIVFEAARRRLLRRRAEEANGMPDITALELSEREIEAQLTTSLAIEVRRFVTGTLLAAALAAAGTVLVTLALVIAVVGSPVLAVAIAWAVVRHRRLERVRALARFAT